MFINELLKKKKTLHFTLIDTSKLKIQKIKEIAIDCENYGTDAILVGSSTPIDSGLLDKTLREIKNSVKLPTIIYPNNLSRYADYLFFISILNSNDPNFLIKIQSKISPLLKEFKLKPISVGFIIVNTSKNLTAVEKISSLETIEEKDIQKVVNYALAAKYFGMSLIYLEAGSGADKPIPNEMIKAVKRSVDIPIIVGGGIRDAKTALEKVNAGANIIVTGNLIESDHTKIKEIIRAIR